MQGTGRPKGCFWRVCFISAPLRLSLQTSENLRIDWENSAVHFFLAATSSSIFYRMIRAGIGVFCLSGLTKGHQPPLPFLQPP